MGTISWQEALMLEKDGGIIEMSFNCSCNREGSMTDSSYNGGWSGHYCNRPSVTGKILKCETGLLFPNGQIVTKAQFDWFADSDEGESDDSEVDLFSDDPDDETDCCYTDIRIVSSSSNSRKEQLKELYASLVKEARALGFTDKDWNEAKSKV